MSPIRTTVHARQTAIVDAMLEDVGILEGRLKETASLVKSIRKAGKPADATGAWLASSGRIMHRVAGLSKPNPPLDPFRLPHGRVDESMRGDPKEPVRRELLYVSNLGHETSITISGSIGLIPHPDHADPIHAMRLHLAFIRSILEDAPVTDHAPEAEAAATLAGCQLMETMQAPPNKRAFIECRMPSELAAARIRVGGIANEDMEGARPAPINPASWPPIVRVDGTMAGGARRWTLMPMHASRRLLEIGDLERLRALAPMR